MGFAKVTRDGAVLTVTIDRQERRNALHSPAHFEMSAIFDEFERDPVLRVAILTGAGEKAFSSGGWHARASCNRLCRPHQAYWPDQARHCSRQRLGVGRRV